MPRKVTSACKHNAAWAAWPIEIRRHVPRGRPREQSVRASQNTRPGNDASRTVAFAQPGKHIVLASIHHAILPRHSWFALQPSGHTSTLLSVPWERHCPSSASARGPTALPGQQGAYAERTRAVSRTSASRNACRSNISKRHANRLNRPALLYGTHGATTPLEAKWLREKGCVSVCWCCTVGRQANVDEPWAAGSVRTELTGSSDLFHDSVAMCNKGRCCPCNKHTL